MLMKLFVRPTMRAAMLAAGMLTLTSCASMTGSSETPEPVTGAETFCKLAKPISWADGDTDATLREIREHNEVWKRLCSGR